MDIAVIIPTFNEEANLPAALDSISDWASQVFVVDSFSTDRTVDIALERAREGIHVVQHEFENYSKQWNWSLTHLPIEASWTLKLDADERVTERFKQEVDEAISTAVTDLEGIYFRRLFHFMGTPLRWGGLSSNYEMRLWKTGKAVFEDRPVNEHALVRGRTMKIKGMVEHHDYKSLSGWIDKHNRYSSLEARNYIAGNWTGDLQPRVFGNPEERRMWLRCAYWKCPGRLILYFLYRYLLRLGILDGRAGFRYCYLHAAYRYWTELKISEYRRRGTLPEIIWPRRGEPHMGLTASNLQKSVDDLPEV